MGASSKASAATITVSAGGNIQNAINSAASGDTVVVNAGTYTTSINGKSGVAIQANGLVTINGGVNLTCNSCSVTGFHFVKGSVWMKGDDIRLEGNDLNGKSNEDYSNVFGNRITIRRNFFHGVRIPQDLYFDGSQYEHTDSIQTWNNNGEVLHDLLIEENIFTDSVQFIFLANETGVLSSMSNFTVRNNVFWGTTFPVTANLIGSPSHGTFIGKAPITGCSVMNNVFYNTANNVSLYDMPSTPVQGNIILNGGTAYALDSAGNVTNQVNSFVRGTVGNILWNNGWNGYPSQGPDKYIDPQLQNLNSLVGPDGVPFTADDGWIPTNAAAKTYGPQITLGSGGNPPPPPPPPPPNTAPSVTLTGPTAPIQLAAGQTTASFNVTANGSDAEGPVTYLWSGGTTINTIACNQPAGSQTYSCTVTDSGGLTATASLTVTVLAATNTAPAAVNDSFSGILEDSSSTVLNVLANDSDANGDPLTITSRTTPNRGGTATIVPGGIAYTPAANFNGIETFSYTISDGKGGTASANVSVTVTAVNDPPIAVNDSFPGIQQGSSGNVLNVLANDSDVDGNTLTITSRTTPSAGGTVTIGSGSLVYTPAANFSGTETFSYTISDGNGGTASANVTVTVAAAVNRPPVATNDSFTGIINAVAATTLNVLANDTDPDGNPLTLVSVTAPSQGGLAVISGNAISYTPKSGFSGTETFSYTISDGKGGTATASVSVTVTKPNTVPVASNDSYTVAEDSGTTVLNVLANDTDADNNTLTITSRTTPSAGGTATIGGGALNYMPKTNFNGTETFSYTISDGNGGTASASVTVTVTPVNDAPVAVNDAASVNMNSSANAIAVLGNDSDVDGDTLTITDLGATSNGGTVSISGSGLSYTPAANYSGTETFTYTVSDGNGGSATATVTVTVTNTDTAPIANPDAFTVAMNSTGTTFSVCANDSDPDVGDSFAMAGLGVPDHGGSVSMASDKTVAYTPAANFTGTESFTYTIKDLAGKSASAKVTLTVKNMSPTTGRDHYKVKRNSTTLRAAGGAKTYRLPVLRNDVSNSGTPLSLVGAVQDAKSIHGLITIKGDDILYTPPADWTGTEEFIYTVRDDSGQSASGNVTVETTDQIGTYLCDDTDAILVEMAMLYADLGLTGADLDSDTIPDDFMLEAMQIIACFDKTTPLGIASQTAYTINLAALDSETNAAALGDYREAIAAMMAMNTEIQGALNQALDVASLSLTKSYEAVSCDGTGACMPQPVAGRSLSDTFQSFDPARGATVVQPFAGASDIDGDGLTNAEEYANVIAAGGSSSEYAAAATDPKLDGTTLSAATPPASGGGGGGGCFIATAAYGTPLASQIDVLRAVRDRDLLVNSLGATFVDTYYRLSPPIARLVADHPAFAALVRVVLWPVVLIGKLVLTAPATMLAAMLAMLGAAAYRTRRRRQHA